MKKRIFCNRFVKRLKANKKVEKLGWEARLKILNKKNKDFKILMKHFKMRFLSKKIIILMEKG